MTFTSLHIYTIHIYNVAFPKLENKLQESWNLWDFPGSPVTNTSLSNVGGLGLTLSQGAEIPLASLPKTKNVKQKKCCIIQQRLLKKGPHQKNLKKKRERERELELGDLSQHLEYFLTSSKSSYLLVE